MSLSLYAIVSTSHAANEAVIWIDPPQSVVAVGQQFNVAIQVGNLPDLAYPDGAMGFQIGIVWDPTILTGISITDVLFSTIAPGNAWNLGGLHPINNTAGSALYAYTFQDISMAIADGSAPITGNHTLAVVTFNGTSFGNSAITFLVVKIGDGNALPMPYETVNGTVAVGNPAPQITVSSPKENATYKSNSIDLAFSVNKETSWIGYSVDGHPNVTISGNTNFHAPDGVHTVVVYANDTIGQMGSSDPINFTTDTLAPTAIFTYSPKPPEPTYNRGNFKWVINFFANESSDAASGIATYNWTFGDGSNRTGEVANHIYATSGTYIVNLTVTDNVGLSASQTQTITIEPASLPLTLPLELILGIVIPAAWIPALAYYFARGSRRRKFKKVR